VEEGEDQGAVWYVSIFIRMNTEITKRNDPKTVLAGADTQHKTENNHPRNTIENRLPKYGSQSGTTIDSCL
jgi:hypothetical protein